MAHAGKATVPVGTALLFVLLAVQGAPAATVGLFSRPNCSSCNLNIPATATEGVFYVCAFGTSSTEFCGGSYEFEFRIEGLRIGWSAIPEPSTAAQYALGDPFDRGCRIAFSTPQTSACTLLYTVRVAPSAPGARATLRTSSHLAPSNPELNCIRAAPACNRNDSVCVGGGALLINSEAACSVAVESASWARIKTLYE